MEYLADTVAVVRFFTKKGKIGKHAKEILTRVNEGSVTLLISVISFVEILYLSEKNRIEINFDDLKRRIEPLNNYQVIPLDLDIIEQAKKIQGLELHDRLIVSTAKYFNVPILTSDT